MSQYKLPSLPQHQFFEDSSPNRENRLNNSKSLFHKLLQICLLDEDRIYDDKFRFFISITLGFLGSGPSISTSVVSVIFCSYCGKLPTARMRE